jgi:hypothetical protein
MKFYIDTDFKCHIDNPDGAFREFHDPFFDGKCQTFVEGYRYVPDGESWTRSDGVVFYGETIFPWKDYAELDAAQREYERELIADMQNALKKLGVTLDE